MTDELVHVHASGCARASSHQQWRALTTWVKDAEADVAVLTEALGHYATSRAWAKLNGYHIVQSVKRGEGECAILIRRGYGHSYVEHWRYLTPLRLRTARKAPLVAVKSCVIDNDHTHLTWVTGAHLPAHVEGQAGLKPGWASHVYRAAALGWSEMRFGKQAPGYIIAADWNLNTRRPWVRAYLRSLFPGTKPGWDVDRLPLNGTHGGRLIDGPRSNLPVAEPSKILPAMSGFDHRAVRTVYRLGEK